MKKPVAALLAVLAIAFVSAPVAADELEDVYAKVLDNPGDTALNLQYAELAEKAGKPRLALAAYERVLLNDPSNSVAQEGIKRITRKLLGDSTRWVASIGAGWESNPANLASHEDDAAIALASLAVHDTRYLGSTNWQTDGLAVINLYNDQDPLNYGFLGIETGPVYDTGSWFTLHPALGGAISYFDNTTFYSEIVGSLTAEGITAGANQIIRLKVGFRDYSSHFTSDSGWYAQLSARWGVPHVFSGKDVVILSPWFRWSDIDGGFPIAVSPSAESEPGRYWELGTDIAYYTPVSENVVVGANITVSTRQYSDPGLFSGSDDRSDTMVSPGATLIFKHVFAYQTDVRLNYRHRDNASNDDAREFEDDVITINLDARW